jgi:hypothetical protein
MKQRRSAHTTNGYIPRVQRSHSHSRVPQSVVLRAATADRKSNRRGSAQQATRLYSFLFLRQMLPLSICTPQRVVHSIGSRFSEQPNKRPGRSTAARVGRSYEAGRASSTNAHCLDAYRKATTVPSATTVPPNVYVRYPTSSLEPSALPSV